MADSGALPPSMRCPHCNNHVLQRGADGRLTLRPKGQVRFAKSACHLECYFCGEALELALGLTLGASERLVVRR